VHYSHWQEGDDEAIEPFLLPEGWVSRERYLSKFDDPLLEPEGVHLAWLRGKVVGHVMTCRRPVFMEGRVQLLGGIGQMLVAESVRGQGVGRALLGRGLKYLEKKGCRAVSLHTNTGLERALNFYAAAGFFTWAEEVIHSLDSRALARKSGIALHGIKPDEALPARLEWAKGNFPVWCEPRAFEGGENLLGAWETGTLAGYLVLDKEGVRQAAFMGADPQALIGAVLQFAAERGIGSLAWHDAAGGFWDGCLKQLSRERKVTGQVRLVKPLGPELDLSGQRPSFWTVRTW